MLNRTRRLGMLGGVALLACGAFVQCKKAAPCRATASFEEKVATGEGPDKQQAFKQACTNHCLEHDTLVDGKYRVWRAAGGKGAGKRAEAIQAVPALKRYLDTCTERCAKQAKDVRYTDCSEP